MRTANSCHSQEMALTTHLLSVVIFGTLLAITLAGVPCPDRNSICSDVAKCVYGGSTTFRCECNPGYTGDGHTCDDIDECLKEADTCDNNAWCHNVNGSFHCHCNDGFTGDGITCNDIDECLTVKCHSNAKCKNTPGNYSCECNPGFAGDGINNCQCAPGFSKIGSDCIDINECVLQDTCDKDATCTNTAGSYMCTCNTGFTGSGKTCTSFDHCSACTDKEQCVPKATGSSCVCIAGYERDLTTQQCVDIDECQNQEALNIRCSRKGRCKNLEGSYGCVCDTNHIGDGYDCLSRDFISKVIG